MRTYEIVFMAAPTLSKEEVDQFTDQIAKTIDGKGGRVVKTDKLGKRSMAYRINKFKEAYYVILTVEGGGAVITEVERRFKVSEPIIRFMSIRVDEAWKRVDKMKAKRSTRVKAPAARPGEPSGLPAGA